jgi:hypothetical protein
MENRNIEFKAGEKNTNWKVKVFYFGLFIGAALGVIAYWYD